MSRFERATGSFSQESAAYFAHKCSPKLPNMRKVVIAGPPPVQVLDVAGPLEVFSNAPDYEIQLANPGLDRTLQTNRGVVLADAAPIAQVQGPIDTLVIAGGAGAENGSYDPNFIAWIAKVGNQA